MCASVLCCRKRLCSIRRLVGGQAEGSQPSLTILNSSVRQKTQSRRGMTIIFPGLSGIQIDGCECPPAQSPTRVVGTRPQRGVALSCPRLWWRTQAEMAGF